jgi:hypothetical protein
MVIYDTEPSRAKYVEPGPSDPDGHKIAVTSLNPVRSEEGPEVTSALERANGTNRDVKGVEPVDCGTFGLSTAVRLPPLDWKEVMKEPPKRREELSAFETMEATDPLRPPNPGGDQLLLEGVYTATEPSYPEEPDEGPRNEPPTHTVLEDESQ